MRVDKEIIKKLILIVKYNYKPIFNSIFINNGIGYYPGVIFINHSCRPNSDYCYKNNYKTIEFRALCDIKKDDEITCCYVEPLESTLNRQKFLLNNYNFICKCDRCLDDNNESDFICIDCKSELIYNNNNKYECQKCKKIYDKDILYNKYDKVDEFFNVGISTMENDRREGMIVLKVLINIYILNSNCYYLLKILDI